MCLGSRFCREGRLCLELGEEVAALRRNFAFSIFFSSNHFLFASKSVGDFFGSNSKPVGKPRTCCRSRWSSRPRRQGSLPTRPSCRLCTGNVSDWFRPNLSRFLCFSNLEPVARVTLLALTLLGVGVAHLVDIVVIISTFSKDFASFILVTDLVNMIKPSCRKPSDHTLGCSRRSS